MIIAITVIISDSNINGKDIVVIRIIRTTIMVLVPLFLLAACNEVTLRQTKIDPRTPL